MPAADKRTPAEIEQRQQAPIKHGAEGALRRVIKGLPLAEDDKQRRDEIIAELGFNPDKLPPGAAGKLVQLVSDNLLLSERFQGARHWAAEQQDIQKWISLAQKSGWRNDKAISQLLDLIKMQMTDTTLDHEALLQEGNK